MIASSLFVLLFLAAAPADAHVGSPDVFYEGNAGPYPLVVSVIVPQVIPGVAEVQVRATSGDVRSISTSVTRLTGPGSNYAPVPDLARRSPIDPQLFSASIWLMEYGSLSVRLNVDGTRGPAQMAVPVPSFARKMLAMPPALGALLLALTIGLGIGAISIVGAAARDAKLEAGAPVTPAARRAGRRAMALTAVVVATIFYFAFAWWNSDASDFIDITQYFKPPQLSLNLAGQSRLAIRPSPTDRKFLRRRVMDNLVPDHGHLMHLFLVRKPGLDRLYHLHPDSLGDGAFEDNLPLVEPGDYQVFADVVDKSGFPWTMIGTIDLPLVPGPPMRGDDSAAAALPINQAPVATMDVLGDGTRVRWDHGAGRLRANTPLMLRFVIEDKNGRPARDLEPYMGMAAHAEIIRDDLSVFAHIHPSGSVPMAALMLASETSAKTSSGAYAMDMDMQMPSMTTAQPNAALAPAMVAPSGPLSPEISMPYGFPKPGLYRIFFQFKRAGRIETATFTTPIL